MVGGALVATNYSASTTTAKKTEAIRMVLTSGYIKKEFSIDPEPPVDPDRLPVAGIRIAAASTDPMRPMLRVPGTSDPLSPEACRVSAGIFDGRMRYDLKLDFKRMETVKAEKGCGQVVVAARCIHPGRGLHPQPPCDQIPRRQAQYRDSVRAGGDHPGSVLDEDPDPARPRHAGGHPVRLRANTPRVAKTR